MTDNNNNNATLLQLFSSDGIQRVTLNEIENTAVVAFQNDDGNTFSDWRKCTYEQNGNNLTLTYVSKKGKKSNPCKYSIDIVGEVNFTMDGDWYEE